MLKKLLIIGMLTASIVTVYSEEAIPESVIIEGERKFNGSRDIFRGTLSDPDAWKVGRDEAVSRMNAAFPQGCVGTILQGRDNKWAVTIKLNDPKTPRKTIVDREKIRIGGNEYLVIATGKGIKVVDLKTKYEIVVEKESLRK